jgi:site-specific recombinase XerD
MPKPNALIIAPQRDVEAQADLRALIADWHAALDLRVNTAELSAASRRTYTEGAQHFFDWCYGYSALTDDVIRDWIADLRGAAFKPATINTWLSGLRAFFAWAVGARRIPYNPAAGIKSAKRTDSRKHKREMLTSAEIRRVLALPEETPVGKRDRAILYLMAYTAARTIEVHRANLDQLRTESDRLVLKVQGKGREEADEIIVITHPQAEAALHDWLSVRGNKPGPLFTSLSPRTRGGRLSLSAIRWTVKSYYKAAGVRGANKTTHSLRHSAISNAINNGAPVQKVRAMARHQSIDTTMIYVHEADRVTNPAELFIDYGE